VAFEAPSKRAVEDFFHAALKAGARIHGEPSYRDSQSDTYNAAVIDFDDNAIEVVYRDRQEAQASGSAIEDDEGSQVLKWQKEVASSTFAPLSTTSSLLPLRRPLTRTAEEAVAVQKP